ncbi:MAG: acyl-CoA synthetase [Arenicellales bacterium]|nr:acyl-CoA synthetase [Arenicellales bacterium]
MRATPVGTGDIFDQDLQPNPANFRPLTPLTYLARAAKVYANKPAVIHGAQTYTYAETYRRCCQLANALMNRGIGVGDTVSIMSPNTPAMLEAHYGVPMSGAVLNALNYRLDAATIAFILNHGEAKILLTDREYSPVISEAVSKIDRDIVVIDIDDSLATNGDLIGEKTYETFLDEGDPDSEWHRPDNEWQGISLNYTSGTTGNPKGVVYHHRGAFLNALGNALVFGLDSQSKYLWTLPMFHCNGWTFTWGVTAAGGTHVCLRVVDPALIFKLIRQHGVTHMCGAPIVLNMLIHAPDDAKQKFDQVVDVATGGAAPPSAVISAMEHMGFRILHLYGLTETYGPATLCAWQEEWDELSDEEKTARMARQGVTYPTLDELMVADPETVQPVPADSETIGELMVRGNTVMKGYLKNPAATGEAMAGGWFHTGDLGVMHPDGYVEVKDRSKDIIISGGENISSLEVEEVLYKHPDVMEAAVVARPDEKWGETPCAFVTLKPDAGEVNDKDIIEFCRQNMAHFKVPKTIILGPLPKTSTGKIQKFVLREKAAQLDG